jgi:hypothetical protein
MPSREFEHYDGCNHRDPDNCSACALTDERQTAPNYAAWPLAYMQNNRPVPTKWRTAFFAEFDRADNPAYVANLKATLTKFGVAFKAGRGRATAKIYNIVGG